MGNNVPCCQPTFNENGDNKQMKSKKKGGKKGGADDSIKHNDEVVDSIIIPGGYAEKHAEKFEKERDRSMTYQEKQALDDSLDQYKIPAPKMIKD